MCQLLSNEHNWIIFFTGFIRVNYNFTLYIRKRKIDLL
jgi:hypothetical protein